MTYLRRVAQLISDLREVNVIREDDKIEYNCIHGWLTGCQITITCMMLVGEDSQSRDIRCDTIYQSFVREFSPEEIHEQKIEGYHGEVLFTLRELSKITREV